MQFHHRLIIGGLWAGLSCSPALAQTKLELYGQVSAWAGAQKQPGSQRTYGINGGGMQAPYWGIKGEEDLGGGRRALFGLEGFFATDDGSQGRFRGDALFSRNAYVGLSGSLGQARAGRITAPYFLSTILFNPFVDSFTFSPMMAHTYRGAGGQGVIGDTGWANAVVYQSPKFGGLQANAAYSFGERPGANGQAKWGGHLLYFGGALAATVAYQQIRFNATPGDLAAIAPDMRRQDAVQLGVSFDAGFVKLFGQYQHIVNTMASGNLRNDGGQLGAAVPMGSGSWLASYAYTRNRGANDTSRSTWSLGYDHNLSKRTDVFVAYTNDRLSGQSHGDSFGVGLRHKF
ncbi:porin [Cupriavidus nantongensis]|uniref:porin n=1 Tax=Cupriavidus nantongensis TaxID=1796606 RepID=UPI00358F2777